MKTLSTICNGRLGDKFRLELKSNVEQDDSMTSISTNKLTLKGSLELIDSTATFKNTLETADLALLINDEVVAKLTFCLDFADSNKLAVADIEHFYNSDQVILDVELRLSLHDNNESNYLLNSSLKDKVIIPVIKEDEDLCLYLAAERDNDVIKCSIGYNTTPDLLEYKVDDAELVKLNSTNFVVKLDELEEHNKHYISVRRKVK